LNSIDYDQGFLRQTDAVVNRCAGKIQFFEIGDIVNLFGDQIDAATAAPPGQETQPVDQNFRQWLIEIGDRVVSRFQSGNEVAQLYS
jgi:hypothetical protein